VRTLGHPEGSCRLYVTRSGAGRLAAAGVLLLGVTAARLPLGQSRPDCRTCRIVLGRPHLRSGAQNELNAAQID